jgi:hypothetical protein
LTENLSFRPPLPQAGLRCGHAGSVFKMER